MPYQPFPSRKTTIVEWRKADPNEDWYQRCLDNPKAPVFDILIVCDDQEKAHEYLEEEYGTQVAATFDGGNKIVRFKDGRFGTVWSKPHTLSGALPCLEKWNWWARFNLNPDLATFREKQQVEEMIKLTFN